MIEHSLVRATVTPQIVTILSRYYGIDLDEAMRRRLSAAGTARLRDFRPDTIQRQLAALLEELCGS